MWGLVQSHGDLKLITLSNHIVKVSSTVRSSETSVILLLSFFFFFFFYARYFRLVSAEPHVKLETFLSSRPQLQMNLSITVLMPHLCVEELRKWGQTVWLLCIFPCWQHTDLLAVNTRVTYIIIWSVCFFFFFLHPEWEWTKPSSLNLFCHANAARERERERERKSRVFISSIIMTDMILLPVVLFVITWTTTL